MADTDSIMAPIRAALNPIGRNILGDGYCVTHTHLTCRGRAVALRRGAWANSNINEAVVVLGVDLGLPKIRHFKHARRLRLMLTAAAATLLALGVVDPPEDAP